MNLLKINWLLIIIASFFSSFAQNSSTIKSGEAIRNTNTEGMMALPFLNGSISGAVDVNGDGNDDIILQSTLGNELFLYQFLKFDKGTPVFKEPRLIASPFEKKDEVIRDKALVIKDNNVIHGFFGRNNYIRKSKFNKDDLKLDFTGKIDVKGLPFPFSNYGIVQLNNGKYLLLFAVREPGVFSKPKDDPNHYGYNSEGFWTFPLMRIGFYGKIVDNLNISEVVPEKLTSADQLYFSADGFVHQTINKREYILIGSRTGLIYAYELDTKEDNVSLKPKKHIVSENSTILKNPNVNSSLAILQTGITSGIVTVGEGGIYYYKNNNKLDRNNNPVYTNPIHIAQENTFLTAGSLPVQNVVDWDGDGFLDIISGNSMGFYFFYKNRGTNLNPKYSDPELLTAGDNIIQVQAGYRGSVQGPGESRWGYTCPTVFDWNGDGVPDLVTGDVNADYLVYLNIGTKTSPKLANPKVLNCEGIDVIGTWRVKPGIAKAGNNLWFINQDKDDDLHLYYALDSYNLEDRGKLMLKGNAPIRASYHDYQGKLGRGKYDVVDWDGDGKVDLLIGTYLNHAFPGKLNGLPFNMSKIGGKKQANVLFMRNLGTNEAPVFEFPKPLKFKGKFIELGVHACSPSATTLGGKDELNLVVGEENGKFMFYKREDLSW